MLLSILILIIKIDTFSKRKLPLPSKKVHKQVFLFTFYISVQNFSNVDKIIFFIYLLAYLKKTVNTKHYLNVSITPIKKDMDKICLTTHFTSVCYIYAT